MVVVVQKKQYSVCRMIHGAFSVLFEGKWQLLDLKRPKRQHMSVFLQSPLSGCDMPTTNATFVRSRQTRSLNYSSEFALGFELL
jgi:hypothetical protein